MVSPSTNHPIMAATNGAKAIISIEILAPITTYA